jgi:hypothetical protein
MRLKTDEAFKGIALFEPDPELEDNPGYYEYYDHFDKQANQYVPCAGDDCAFCAANDNPSTRALTVWYMPQEGNAADQIKVFTMNYGTINEISDEAEEEDGILGKNIRVKRLDDRGNYRVRVLSDKPMSKTEQKKVMALLVEKFPDGLEAVVQRQLATQIERLKAIEALEDDDDEDEEDEIPTRSRRGKAVEDEEEDDDEDEEDEDEEDEGDEDEDDEEEEDEDDEEEEEEDEDDDEDDDEEEEESEESDDDEEEEPTEITAGEYEVVTIQEKDEIFSLKDSEGTKVKMWLGEGVDVDYDVVKKGVTITLDAEQDDEGDWIITSLTPPKKAPARRTRKPASTRKPATSRKPATRSRTTRKK